MSVKEIHKLFLSCKSISIDTRKIENNSMFVAIKGDRFDANTFAKEAIDKGAKFVIIDNKNYFIDERTILVENSLKTLQELASYHRDYLKIPIISLTGSNGKTTTKELINVVLSKKYNAKATLGNLNNHIGVPLTILSFTSQTQIGIVEMGANHQKEIAFLCSIAKPDYGYITNFGKAHLEGFGGIDGVIKGKSEMYDYLKANDKLAFVNADDAIQAEKTSNIKKHSFSIHNATSEVVFSMLTANPFVTFEINNTTINSNLIGIYNSNNIFAAITIGIYFGIEIDQIKNAIESYVPDNNRSQLIEKNSNKIILDCYNANPSSMKVALENFLQLKDNHKIAILGDMFELGEESLLEHHQIVDYLKDKEAKVYFIGNDFYRNTLKSNNLFFYHDFEDFKVDFTKQLPINSTILIKGSRGMALEKVLEIL